MKGHRGSKRGRSHRFDAAGVSPVARRHPAPDAIRRSDPYAAPREPMEFETVNGPRLPAAKPVRLLDQAHCLDIVGDVGLEGIARPQARREMRNRRVEALGGHRIGVEQCFP